MIWLITKAKKNKASKRFHVTMSTRKQQTRPQAAKATNNSGWSMSHLEMRFASSTASSDTVAYEHIILRHFFILISLTCKSSQIHVLHIYFSSVYYVEGGNSQKLSCKVFKILHGYYEGINIKLKFEFEFYFMLRPCFSGRSWVILRIRFDSPNTLKQFIASRISMHILEVLR